MRAHNGGTIFRPVTVDPASPGRWLLVYDGPVGHWLGPVDRRLYGSAIFGKGGHLLRETALGNVCATSQTTLLLDPSGASAFAGANGFTYRIRAEFLVCDVNQPPTVTYGATLYAVAKCYGGAVTVSAMPPANVADGATGGISVSVSQLLGFITFGVTNSTGVSCRASCAVFTQELVTA